MIRTHLYSFWLQITLIIIVLSPLLPIFHIGGFGFKLDLILISILSIDLIFNSKFYLSSKISLFLITIMVLLFISMLLSDNLGILLLSSNPELYFPREYIQIFSRFSVFLICFRYSIQHDFKFKVVSVVFIIALIIGLLQMGDLFGLNSFFSELYSPNENQANAFMKKGISLRIFGVAGNPISWGGFSVFIFYYFVLIERSSIRKSGALLSLINIFLSVSKAAILGLLSGLLLFPLVYIIYYKFSVRKLFAYFNRFLVFSILFLTSIYFLFFQKFEFLIFRIFAFINQSERQNLRINQVVDSLDLMFTFPVSFLVGFGKPTVDRVLEYVELEPVYILVSYGMLGMLLHYVPLLFLVQKSYILRKYNRKLAMFVPISIFSYFIFSIGFYFFRELQVGTTFWLVSGLVFGSLQKINLKSKINV